MQTRICKIKTHQKPLNIVCVSSQCLEMSRLFCQKGWKSHNVQHPFVTIQKLTAFIAKYNADIQQDHQAFTQSYSILGETYNRFIDKMLLEKQKLAEIIKKIEIYFLEISLTKNQKDLKQQIYAGGPNQLLDYYTTHYVKHMLHKPSQPNKEIKAQFSNFHNQIIRFVQLLQKVGQAFEQVNKSAEKYSKRKFTCEQTLDSSQNICNKNTSDQVKNVKEVFQKVVENQEQSKDIALKNQQSKPKQASYQQPQNIIQQSSSKMNMMFEQNKQLFPNEIIELSKNISDSSFISIMSEKKSNYVEQQKQENVEILQKSQRQILEQFKQLEEKNLLANIKKVVIKATNRQKAINDETLEIIEKMVNLQWLEILWMVKVSRKRVTIIIKSLTKLKVLILGKFTMKGQFLKQLSRTTNNLRICENLYDYHHNFENQLLYDQFLCRPEMQESQASQIKFLTNLPSLESLWIPQPDSSHQASELFQYTPHLKYLKLGCFSKKSKSVQINKQLFEIFQKFKNIRKIQSFVSINICKKYLTILKKMSNLKTLVLIKTARDKETYDQIQNLEELRQLLLSGINIKTLRNLRKLTHLSIDCEMIQDKQKQKVIQILKFLTKKLELLSLRLLTSADKDLIFGLKLTSILSDFSNLSYLNINSCGINREALFRLNKLINLKTLICGQNPLEGADVADFAQSNNERIQIQKLVLQGLNGQNGDGTVVSQDLIRIAKAWDNITHLNIYNVSVIKYECLQNFIHLKLIKMNKKDIPQDTLKLLAHRNISIIQQ